MLKPHDRVFIPLDKTPRCDGRTDGQKWSSYYSGLHCEQCGRAVKNRKIINNLAEIARFP